MCAMRKAKSALSGIRVLDLGRYQAGPRCGLMLARLGAEVIKIEAPEGDESRDMAPFVRGQSAYWPQYNSGKKSITLDLRTAAGKGVLRDLAKVSDVLIQNFRPGVMDKMGFGYRALRRINKRIVMVNVSAYGQFGPYRDRVGFDPIGQAICGLMSLTGFEGTPPTRSFATIVDRVTALHATIGALAALRERELSGEGQAIDVSLVDAGFTLMEIQIAAYLGAGIEPKRAGNGEGLPQPSNTFQCKDGWVYIISPGNKIWPRVCTLLKRPEWTTDHGMKTSADRRTRNPEIIAALDAYCRGRTVGEVVDDCTRLDLPAAPVNTLPQAAKDPHIAAREIMVEVPDPVAGKIHVSGKSIHLSRTPMVIGSTPTIGQHTDEVLKGLLTYSERKIAGLRKAKAI